MPQQRYYLAIDIGASSGRHVLGSVNGNGVIELEEVHRFDNVQVRRRGHDCWDIDMIWENILVGLEKCRKAGKIPETIGIDTWGVDFVLVDAQGRLVGDAVAYRDARTNDVAADVDAGIGLERLYRVTGIQRQAFNTVYQLAALSRERPEELEAADRFLMVPEYLNYLLTGNMVNEYTNATTTNLVNARTCTWDAFALEAAEAPARLFGEIAMPGTVVGGLAPEVQQRVGFDARVMLPATHDTGSAFLAVPARDAQAVYLSSGTWSLLGVEHEGPITSDASRYQNFTNEGGYLKRFRFLKNIMGLWMIQSIRRELNGVSYVSGKGAQLKRAAKEIGFGELADAARAEQKLHPDAPVPHVNVNDDRFLAPDSMIEEIKAACRETGQPVPDTVGELMRCVYESLTGCYADSINELSALTGRTYTSINIVGGGCQDTYLNELTARACGIPVFAGPIEGTSLGNLMVQMIGDGVFADLDEAREAIRGSFDVVEYQPE